MTTDDFDAFPSDDGNTAAVADFDAFPEEPAGPNKGRAPPAPAGEAALSS